MKLTEWYPASVKPVRSGVYERNISTGAFAVYQNWNGMFWGFYGTTPKTAASTKYKNQRSAIQICPWRGLAENPSKGKK